MTHIDERFLPPGTPTTCPLHAGEGYASCSTSSDVDLCRDLWLVRRPITVLAFPCGTQVRVDWPHEWNQAHPDYRFWGPNVFLPSLLIHAVGGS